MQIQRVSSGVGAMVSGVDVRSLDPTEVAELDAAWATYGVLFLRDQELSPDELLGFATKFAPVDPNQFFATVADQPEVAQVLKEPHQQYNIGGDWHTDHSYDVAPARGSVTYAVEIPPVGGDTLFADVAAAADALSKGMLQTLSTLRAVHTNDDVFGAGAAYAEKMEGRLSNPEATSTTTHPVLAEHPITGRTLLYVNPGFVRRFEGWTVEESQPLLDQLYAHIAQPQFTTRFSWREGSMAMWDNRSVWHAAINDYQGHRRLLHRVTVQGEPLKAALTA